MTEETETNIAPLGDDIDAAVRSLSARLPDAPFAEDPDGEPSSDATSEAPREEPVAQPEPELPAAGEGAVSPETKPEEPADEHARLRAEDYTKKTQRLADERREFEQTRKQLEEQYQQAIQQAQHILQSGYDPILAEAAKTDWAKLAQEDPATYVARKAQADERLHQVRAVQAEAQRLHQERLTKLVEEEKEKLLNAVPEWRNKDVVQKQTKEVVEYLVAQGFRKEELDNMIDHRLFVQSRKAMLYDQMVTAQKTLVAKKAAPPPTKAIKPGIGEGDREGPGSRELFTRFRRSGTIDDAVAALNARLNT